MLALIYLWLTISHFSVCLPTLELTNFKKHVCSTNIGYANALSLWKNSCKKRNVTTVNNSNLAKKQWNLDSSWLENQQYDLHSLFWILWSYGICSVLEQNCKKYIFKNNNQTSSTVATRTWILCDFVLLCINKNKGVDSLPFLAFRRHVVNVIFLKYSKEKILSSSHLEIWNIPSVFAKMTANITRYNLNTGAFRTP